MGFDYHTISNKQNLTLISSSEVRVVALINPACMALHHNSLFFSARWHHRFCCFVIFFFLVVVALSGNGSVEIFFFGAWARTAYREYSRFSQTLIVPETE